MSSWSFDITLNFPNFLRSQVLSRLSTCEAIRIHQFITNIPAPFHLWRKENLVKHQKSSKYYDHGRSVRQPYSQSITLLRWMVILFPFEKCNSEKSHKVSKRYPKTQELLSSILYKILFAIMIRGPIFTKKKWSLINRTSFICFMSELGYCSNKQCFLFMFLVSFWVPQ